MKDFSTDLKPKEALLFGSFNPLHEGHLAILKYILEKVPDCRAGLVVSPESPFKKGMGSSGRSRLDAVREAVAGVRAQFLQKKRNVNRHGRGDY